MPEIVMKWYTTGLRIVIVIPFPACVTASSNSQKRKEWIGC